MPRWVNSELVERTDLGSVTFVGSSPTLGTMVRTDLVKTGKGRVFEITWDSSQGGIGFMKGLVKARIPFTYNPKANEYRFLV